jgi:hypothetical protein
MALSLKNLGGGTLGGPTPPAKVIGGMGGAGYYPTSSKSGLLDLSALRGELSKVRPYQDVNLPEAPMPTRPERIGLPGRGAYQGSGTGKKALESIRGDMAKTREEYYNPTGSAAFKNLMALASTQTARAADEASRTGQEAAARRGYVGGMNVANERTSRDRMRALAEQGFAGSAQIRGEAGKLFGEEMGAYAGLAGSVTQAETESAVAYAKDVLAAKVAQGQLDAGYANQLLDRYKTQVEATLGQGQLRESGRRTDLESLLGAFGLAARNYQGQNEMALLREKYNLEGLSAAEAEKRRREAMQFDYDFQQKHAIPAAKTKVAVGGVLDPREAWLRKQREQGIPTYK